MSALFDVISIINTDGRSDFVLWLRQSSAQHAASRSHIPVFTSLQEEGTDQTIFAVESACSESEVMSLSCIVCASIYRREIALHLILYHQLHNTQHSVMHSRTSLIVKDNAMWLPAASVIIQHFISLLYCTITFTHATTGESEGKEKKGSRRMTLSVEFIYNIKSKAITRQKCKGV